jgi:hypothetical protein
MPTCPACAAELPADDGTSCPACGADTRAPAEVPDVMAGSWSTTSDDEPPALAGGVPLGSFHPAVAPAVAALLARRGIGHLVVERDDVVEVQIDPDWRDDLRAELTVSWGELVRRLDPEVAREVTAIGGSAPGWYDAPRGGYVDRAGRLVVAVDDEDDEDDAARVIGPLLFTVGAIALVVGWWVLDSDAIAAAGFAAAVTGLFVPR